MDDDDDSQEDWRERFQVVGWRFSVLVDAGYPPSLAEAIAEADVDLHQAVYLREAGCDSELAADILL